MTNQKDSEQVANSLAEQALNAARARLAPESVAIAEPDAPKKKAGRKATNSQSSSTLPELEKTLWATADKLRANMDAAEYKHLVLGLIFLKFISDTFQAKRAELMRRFTDPADDYFLTDATTRALAVELEDRDYHREVNVFWVPEAARWEALRAGAKQPDIGKRIDEALSLIEVENPKLKGILDKRFARAQLPDGKLGELVDLVSTIGFGASPGRPAMCSASVRVLPRHVCQCRGQTRRPVLYAAQHREDAGGRAGTAPRQGVRPVLRLGRHVRAERGIHRGPRRQARRRGHLRRGGEPDHLAPGGDEPGHSRHRLQPRP